MRCGQGSGKKAMCLEQKRAKRQEGPHRTRPGLEAQGSQPLVVRGYVVIRPGCSGSVSVLSSSLIHEKHPVARTLSYFSG